MSRLVAALITAAFAASLAGCGSSEEPTAPIGVGRSTSGPLGEGTYSATTATGRTLVPGSELRLQFTGTGVGGNAGCNTFGLGSYRIESGRLVVQPAKESSTTLMDCGTAIDRQDRWFRRWMMRGLELDRADGEITLSGRGVRVTFRDVSAR